MKDISIRRIAPVLGLLGAIGPLSIDMYLPGMPRIAADLGVDEGMVQYSLMTFFLGLMIGQLFYGPVSDKTGRKPMIFVGLILFTIASIACSLANTVEQLIAWRFAQGLGGSIGMVIALSVARDLFVGRQAATLVGVIMVVIGVAPIIAPLLGTFIMNVLPWPMLFVLMAVFSTLCLVLVSERLPETRSAELRKESNPFEAVQNYAHLLCKRNFITYAGTQAFAQAGFLAYLAGSSFIYISVYGLSPAIYSILFALNALGMIGGAQLAPRLMKHYDPRNILRIALLIYTIAAFLLFILEISGNARLLWVALLLFLVVSSLGCIGPLSGTLALESYGEMSGTAAALIGALQFGIGAIASFVVGATADGSALPMIATIAFSGFIACMIAICCFPYGKTKSTSDPTK